MLLAATHPQLRWALRTVLGEEPFLTVAGEASTYSALLSQAGTIRPDLILLDWDLLESPRAGTLAALRQMDARLAIIVVSERPDLRQVALAAGADAYLCKCDPPAQFLATLRGVLAGGTQSAAQRSRAAE